MQRKTLHIARDFFFLGGIIPVVLLIVWRLWFEYRAGMAAQRLFVKVALVLWPAGLQMLFVPHAEGDWGRNWTIAVMIAQNAILYSLIALAAAWVIGRIRHHHGTHAAQQR